MIYQFKNDKFMMILNTWKVKQDMVFNLLKKKMVEKLFTDIKILLFL